MGKKLDYQSEEYDVVAREAERIHWNDDGLSPSELEARTRKFEENLHEAYGYNDENANKLIKRATHR